MLALPQQTWDFQTQRKGTCTQVEFHAWGVIEHCGRKKSTQPSSGREVNRSYKLMINQEGGVSTGVEPKMC